jgi:hypothetical protein
MPERMECRLRDMWVEEDIFRPNMSIRQRLIAMAAGNANGICACFLYRDGIYRAELKLMAEEGLMEPLREVGDWPRTGYLWVSTILTKKGRDLLERLQTMDALEELVL